MTHSLKKQNVFTLEQIEVTTPVNFHSRVNCSFKSDRGRSLIILTHQIFVIKSPWNPKPWC